MRRKEKQISDPSIIKEILENNRICRVAFVDGNVPYLVPMNYGYKDKTLYLHSALEGRKIDILKKNQNVCVEITDSVEIKSSDMACKYTTSFRSLICNGKIHSVDDIKKKIEGLQIIMKQHSGREDWDIPERAAQNVLVLNIKIESLTGKISGL